MGREKDMEEKRYRIIGTAGHIDHGKTWLVKALTGTDKESSAASDVYKRQQLKMVLRF